MKLRELYHQFIEKKIDKTTYIDLMHENHKILFEYFDYIKNTDVASITIEQNSIYLTIRESGIKLLLDPYDKRFIPIEILNFKATEAMEKEIIMKLISHCKNVVDVGANIGWYTLNFGKLENIEKIYSFEPIPYTFAYLKKHVEFNKISKAEIFNIGLSNEIGQKNFFWTTEETGSSSMANIRERNNIEIVKCEINTLDNFLSDKNIVIDFLKIDVEGAELFVLEGAATCIEEHKPIIFSELLRKWSAKFNYHPNDVINLLKKAGYSVYIASQGGLKNIELIDDETYETNFFFLHENNHRSLINKYVN
ncbi:MAG: FkbM family methyltransferase [Pseudomonadota bacterium]